jgi:D-proline reductase (dithiol) PrdA
MSKEKIKAHYEDPAILCCQRKKGTVISEADLEDPTIFGDLEDSGLLEISVSGLLIKEVLGATLSQDVDALTSITPDKLVAGTAPAAAPVTVPAPTPAAAPAPATAVATPAGYAAPIASGTGVHIHIDSLAGLDITLPAGSIPYPAGAPLSGPDVDTAAAAEAAFAPQAEAPVRDEVLRSLVKKSYAVTEVKLGKETSFSGGVLTIDKSLIAKAKAVSPLVKDVEVDIVTPEKRHIFTNTIMDIIPIAAKVTGKIGSGESNIIEGAVFCLTGLDENGVQVHEFGSSEGFLDEKIAYGRPGSPDEDDIIIRVNVVVQKNTGMERRGPLAAHTAADEIIQDIREVLKTTSEPVLKEEIVCDMHRHGRPRVVLVKEIMGQGAMHDNILLPNEPAGVQGGQKNVDIGNVPVMLSPNEVRDGGIHALTCIGPATKEVTRHYFREPLVESLANDPELDFVGVIFIGSPQVNDEKTYVSERLGVWIETMALDGAIVTTEGFGNNHNDFAGNIAEIGSRGVAVVGVTFSAYQGQLVVGNEYMDAMIEINKDENGLENEIVACSSIVKADADRANLMLKTKMAGIPIEAPERKWTPSVIEANQKLTDQAYR